METLESKTETKVDIHPDTLKTPEKVKILIVEDNEFYNSIITRQIQLLLNSIGYSRQFEFELLPYIDVSNCVSDIKTKRFYGVFIVAFLDYYLKRGINGLKLSMLIKSINRQNKVVLFTQSHDYKLWRKLKRSSVDHCLYKDESTPFECKNILEQILFKVP